ncbi:glycoside hydrolase family 3 protein [Microbacterium sp. SORGH_AS_0862]|uniref:glycoside hydrolase family 3 protein n=1 Tax=Microbacterium sp. SORGH_AS_0862 TaxID=3041789 RepID=UPI00278F062F|nr:glycoside hydrolase family 3 N-terminal domain-containing protein [Microbacterium sp. SORGH_AS_0862]MDQ1205520.1 beta-glucosidase [Microbacterium sp. SORGH_AS_0862]
MNEIREHLAPVHRPWLDAALPAEHRTTLLLSEMTLEEKAGQMFHTMVAMGGDGELAGANDEFGMPSTEEYVTRRMLSHFNLLSVSSDAAALARWNNRLQQLALSTRLGIPVTVSSDPRHSFTDNPGATLNSGAFSQWPEPLGLAAARDERLVEAFADTVRREYLAVGIRVALHPQVDLATEPRWARQLQTFGEDAELVARLGAAYVRGLQGDDFGVRSVSAMVKHFPGGGPQRDGEDPHFAYGREQEYPGGRFDLHLKPFIDVFAAGARQVMPYYGMPVGTTHEEVGFGFSRSILTTLLREELGFEGIVCTDWGLITDQHILGTTFPARAWGVEHLSPQERMIRVLDAGADQFGGEDAPAMLVELVRAGRVSEDRLDISVRRILTEKFELGLFDDPFADEQQATSIVGAAPLRALGDAAQRASITVISNDGVLPLRRGLRLYTEGFHPDVVRQYGIAAEDPSDADVAVIRLQAPFDVRESAFENFFHAGSLEFDPALVANLAEIAERVPVIIDVFLDRPAIIEPLLAKAAAVTANWGASGAALLDVLTGAHAAQGKLPFDLPRSMRAIEESRPDVPFDTADALFRFGHGLEIASRRGDVAAGSHDEPAQPPQR